MSDQSPPSPPPPPGWGAPPEGPPGKRPMDRNTRRNLIALGVIGGVVVLIVVAGIIGALAGGGTDSSTAPTTPAATTPPASAEPTASEPTEPPDTGPATAKVGETISFEDSFGDHAVDVTITRKRISTGDEFTKPDNGVFVGLFVRVKAFKDGISVPNFYGLVRGKHYDATCCMVEAWKPELSTYSNLNSGETAEGWVLLDVPSRTGKLVMQEFASEKAQAIWTY